MSFTVQTQLKEERGKTKNSLGIWYSSFEQQQSKLLSLNLHRVAETTYIGLEVWMEILAKSRIQRGLSDTKIRRFFAFFLLEIG